MNLHNIQVSHDISTLPIDALSSKHEINQQYQFRSNSISTDGTDLDELIDIVLDEIEQQETNTISSYFDKIKNEISSAIDSIIKPKEEETSVAKLLPKRP